MFDIKKDFEQSIVVRKLLLALVFIAVVLIGVAVSIFAKEYFSYKKDRVFYEDLSKEFTSDTSNRAGNTTTNLETSDNSSPDTIEFYPGDIIGWLKFDSVSIDYPIVCSANNEDYLNKNSLGEENKCGSLFLDCGNKYDFSDTVSIIHGHNMKDGSMFGNLKQLYQNSELFKACTEFVIKTTARNIKYKVVCCTTIPEDDPLYLVEDCSVRTIQDLYEKSALRNDTSFSIGDRFVVLSTCSSKGQHLVLVAKEIVS